MSEYLGTVVRGIKAPIIKENDDVVKIVTDSVLEASKCENFLLQDRDIIGITEAIVARAQGNYATIDQIAQDVKSKFKGKSLGVVFPILSRNRFSMLLRAFARAKEKVVLMFSYPSDEVGNPLLTYDQLDNMGVNPYSDLLTLTEFRKLFGKAHHLFTQVDYIDFYQQLVENEGAECEIIFCNNPRKIVDYTSSVLCADIHTRIRTKKMILQAGAQTVLTMDEILNESIKGSGYNPEYGLLGSNQATDESVKLFPRDGQQVVENIQQLVFEKIHKQVEVLVYGDGAFKDPVGKIWELADPVVSPAFTSGLLGQPNEIKLKYLADNEFSDLKGEDLKKAIQEKIKHKKVEFSDEKLKLGTTPRQLTDLIGSLCDLTSGSGDKGTPIVFIQNYFTNFASEK